MDLNNAIASELNLVDTDSLISLLLPITHPLVSFADLWDTNFIWLVVD